MRTYLRVLAYTRPYTDYLPQFLVVTFFAILFGLLNLVLVIPLLEVLFDQTANAEIAQAYATAPSFDGSLRYFQDLFYYHFFQFIESNGKLGALKYVCVLLVASVFLANVFRAGSNLMLASIRIKLVKKLRQHIFDHVSRLPLGYFSEQRKGDLLTRMSSDAVEVEYTVVNSLKVYFKEPFQIVAYFIMLFAISPTLTFITLFTIPISAGIIARVIRSLKRPARQGQNLVGKLMNKTEELLSGMRIVKIFTAEGGLSNKFASESQKLAGIQWRMARKFEVAAPLSEFLNVTVVAVILFVGGRMIISGESTLEASEFIGFLAIFSQVVRPAKALSNAFNGLQKGLAAADRIFELLDEPEEPIAADEGIALNTLKDSIHLQDVKFRYQPDLPWVLQGISLTINRGETVALVGPSGSGKSTLVDLIGRFYDPEEGTIFLDQHPLPAYQLPHLRQHIAMVTQESILFNDTIYQNILFGKPTATRQEVEQAAQVAQAHDFILESEKGYDTIIGDQGTKLSGGQRQRLSIARAVLKDPDILILDEATSALDSESEMLVQKALDNLLKGRTAIVIAHRLSTIRSANKIVVLDGGKIQEVGTHDELVKKQGLYQRLSEMQWMNQEGSQKRKKGDISG